MNIPGQKIQGIIVEYKDTDVFKKKIWMKTFV